VNYNLSLYTEEEVKRDVVIHRRRGKERGRNSQKRR
jgi:hypothetical protein